jgi:hypothetical protein
MSSTDISNILKQLDELSQPRQLPALFKPHNISPVLGSPEKKNPMSGYFVGGEGAEPDAKPVWYAIRHRDTGHTLSSHKDEAAARDEMAGLGDRRQEYKLVKTSRRPNQFGLDEEDSGGQQYAVTIDAIDHGVLSPITVTASNPAAAKQKAIASATASMAKRGYELQVRSAAVKSAQGVAEAKVIGHVGDVAGHGKVVQCAKCETDLRDDHGFALDNGTYICRSGKCSMRQAKNRLAAMAARGEKPRWRKDEGVAEATGDKRFDSMMGKITGGAGARQGVDSLNKSLTARTGSNPETALAKWGQEFIKWLEDICRNFAKQGADRISKLENLGNLDDGGETMAHWLIEVAKKTNTSGITPADIQEFSSEFNTHGMWAWQHFPIAWSQSEWQDYKDQWTGPDGYIASLGQGVAEGSSSPDEYKRRLASIQSLRYDNPQEYAKQYRALLQAMPEEHAAHANQAQKGSYSPGERGAGTGRIGGVAEEASPMITPPSNRFDSKQEAFAHAKAHGGKVFKSTYTDPNTGNKNVSFVVKKDQDVEEGWKQKLGAAALAGSMAMGASAGGVSLPGSGGSFTPDAQQTLNQRVQATKDAEAKEHEESMARWGIGYLKGVVAAGPGSRALVPYEDAKKELARREAAYQKRAQGVDEVAPPGARAERMVKHIKQGYAKDGKLTGKEKAIAYATTWKAHNQGQVEEASADLVGFHLDTERAYNAVMERFGDVVEQDPESGMMTVPRRYWPQLEQVAHDADGIGAIEAGGEKIAVDEVEESYWQPQIDEAIAQEDVLDKEKRHLGDYLQSVADAVKHDAALSSKDTPTHSGDTIGSAVKTVTTDDGHDLKIHGNEDDGFRISIKGRPSSVKFKSLDEAGMACEMYRSHRRHKLESADYIEEQ